MGEIFGLDVVDDDKEENPDEQDEEDKEVQRIVNQGNEAKRKLITGKVYGTIVCTLVLYN